MAYKNPYYDPSKAHHTPTGFRNLEPIKIDANTIRRWQIERIKNNYPYPPENGYASFIKQWQTSADFSTVDNRIWWLSHASVLLRLGNLHILTDPVFSKRASPSNLVGPIRKTPPPFDLVKLPNIDVVLISHNHYDHLDLNSIKWLIQRSPHTKFIVPLGLKSWFKKRGAKNIVELDWWQDITIDDLTLTSVPAQHWSRRYTWDTNRTLWSGWMISHQQKNYYFAGDTGYSSNLIKIGQQFSINLAILPIGAYAPRWMMSPQHIDPFDAVRLHQELGCQRSLAIHWGAFELADEPIDEPPILLREACLKQQISTEEFVIIPMGGSLAL